jgi:hypothetical protein
MNDYDQEKLDRDEAAEFNSSNGTFLSPFPGRAPNLPAPRVDPALLRLVRQLHTQHPSIREDTDSAMDRTEAIKSRLAALEAELAALETVPNPADYEDDTVLSFERNYEGVTDSADPFVTWYTYVALKKAGKWYLTGRRSAAGEWSDSDLRDLLAKPTVRNIFVATAWEPMAKIADAD